MIQSGCYGVQVATDDAQIMKHLKGPEQGYSGRFRDDLTGEVLKDSLVGEARAKELAFFCSKACGSKLRSARRKRARDVSPSV